MTKSLYVTSSEAKSGRSFISYGLAELLMKKNQQLGFFRPIINPESQDKKEKNIRYIMNSLSSEIQYEDTYALTRDQAIELINQKQYDQLIEIVLKKFKALEEKCTFVLCEGTSYCSDVTTPFELELNADLAKNLGTPVMIVSNAYQKNTQEVTAVIRLCNDYFERKGCKIMATIVNRASHEVVENIMERFSVEMAQEKKFFALIPENDSPNKKSELLLKIFKQHINTSLLEKAIYQEKSPGITYKMFEYELLKKARSQRQHIVLPEGDDERILQAAEMLKARNIVDVTVLGNSEKISKTINELNLNLDGITIIDPANSPLHTDFSNKLFELRKHKGMTIDHARELMLDVNYFGTMMLHLNMVDGMVSGAAHTTGETIRPGLQIIKTKKNCSIVSSVFLMCLEGRIVTYGDCAVNPNPGSKQLAEIAISSAETACAFGIEPKIAMLSYASGTSASGPEVQKVAEATQMAKELRPDFLIEGPIQYDAAVVPKVGQSKMPGSLVAGHATVLVFPDLNTGNNTYKAVQRESGAEAIGPILQGLNKPLNDLSRGCSVLDIVNTTIVTALQAQANKK